MLLQKHRNRGSVHPDSPQNVFLRRKRRRREALQWILGGLSVSYSPFLLVSILIILSFSFLNRDSVMVKFLGGWVSRMTGDLERYKNLILYSQLITVTIDPLICSRKPRRNVNNVHSFVCSSCAKWEASISSNWIGAQLP